MRPIVKLTARGSEIEHGDLSVDKLAANIDVDWRGQRNSHADVAISELKVGERSLTQFNATLDGTTADHAVRADALAGMTSLHLSGKGGFADGVWKGTIGDLFIDDTANINLQLDTPVTVRASAKDVQAGCVVPARQGRAACAAKARGTRRAGPRAPMHTICRSAR